MGSGEEPRALMLREGRWTILCPESLHLGYLSAQKNASSSIG